MKTFEQILEQYEAKFYDDDYPEENAPLNLYHELDVMRAVKEWLTQNRQDIGNQIYSDHRVVAETVFDVLLEGLKK